MTLYLSLSTHDFHRQGLQDQHSHPPLLHDQYRPVFNSNRVDSSIIEPMKYDKEKVNKPNMYHGIPLTALPG